MVSELAHSIGSKYGYSVTRTPFSAPFLFPLPSPLSTKLGTPPAAGNAGRPGIWRLGKLGKLGRTLPLPSLLPASAALPLPLLFLCNALVMFFFFFSYCFLPRVVFVVGGTFCYHEVESRVRGEKGMAESDMHNKTLTPRIFPFPFSLPLEFPLPFRLPDSVCGVGAASTAAGANARSATRKAGECMIADCYMLVCRERVDLVKILKLG